MTALLIGIVIVKGEKPQWRWRDKANKSDTPTPGNQTHKKMLIERDPSLLKHLLLGPMLLLMTVFFLTHLPSDINGSYGYRTAMSRANQEAWDEAQRYSATVMMIAAAVTVVFQLVSIVTMKPRTSLIASVIFLVIGLILVFPITEIHLKTHFDRQGTRIIRQ